MNFASPLVSTFQPTVKRLWSTLQQIINGGIELYYGGRQVAPVLPGNIKGVWITPTYDGVNPTTSTHNLGYLPTAFIIGGLGGAPTNASIFFVSATTTTITLKSTGACSALIFVC